MTATAIANKSTTLSEDTVAGLVGDCLVTLFQKAHQEIGDVTSPNGHFHIHNAAIELSKHFFRSADGTAETKDQADHAIRVAKNAYQRLLDHLATEQHENPKP